MKAPRIRLASTSRYRAELLRRFCADFEPAPPAVDEALLVGEAPAARALRLAIAKAAAIPASDRDCLVIGSDQVAALGQAVLRKPGDPHTAQAQLRASSGKQVDFFTGLCLLDHRDGQQYTHLDHTRVQFRHLDDAEIKRYLERETPFDCAGSFKVEGAGIALFERIDSHDPTALIGLPLIALARLLRQAGLAVP